MSQLVMEFIGAKGFEAYRKAANFQRRAGFSLAPISGNEPIGFRYGEYTIEYWNKLTPNERHNLHGVVTARNFRGSPVIVTLYSDAPENARKSFVEAME